MYPDLLIDGVSLSLGLQRWRCSVSRFGNLSPKGLEKVVEAVASWRTFFPGCISDTHTHTHTPHMECRIVRRDAQLKNELPTSCPDLWHHQHPDWGKTLSRWSVSPCCLFRLQGHFSENRACRGDHHSVRRSFHESFFCGSSSKNGQTLGNDWVTKVHKHSWFMTYWDLHWWPLNILKFNFGSFFVLWGVVATTASIAPIVHPVLKPHWLGAGVHPGPIYPFVKEGTKTFDVFREACYFAMQRMKKWQDWKQIKLPWLQIANRDSHLPAHLSTEILVHQGNLHGSRSLIW